MSQSPLAIALAPLAERLPKVVREHEILRVAASISGKNSIKVAEFARRECLAWAQNRSGGRLPDAAWAIQEFEYFAGGRNIIGVRIVTDSSDIWGIRTDDPDKSVAGRVWTTEIVIGVIPGQPTRFSVRLLVSTSEDTLDIEPHSPGLLQQIVETCGLWHGSVELNIAPWLVDSADAADQLWELLVDRTRSLPVFVLTVPENAPQRLEPLLDARALSRATLGLAHVVILSADQAWALTERVGKQRSVFGGAVRAYLPGFTEDANPYDHRLILAAQLSAPQGAAQCTRWMRSFAAKESLRRNRLGYDVVAFGVIRNASLELRQRQLEREGASESEKLKAAMARISALEKQLNDEEASLEYFSSEHQSSVERAEAAESQARSSDFRVQQLLVQLKEAGQAIDSNISLPNSWGELANWCDTNLAGRVVLTPPARRGIRSPDFGDVRVAARCMLWLANECRDRRLSGGDGSLADQFVEDGIHNSHCGADQFDIDWRGNRYTADWHIKNGGNTRDPTRCLRIYYFWDAATQQIVVAEMPAHRRTGAS